METEYDLRETSVTWQGYEYLHFEKSSDWYWILGIIALTGAVVSILLSNLLLAVLIVLAAIVGGLYAGREPKLVECSIDRRGIRIDKTRYEFDSLESFWVETEDAHPVIVLKSKKTLMPLVLAPLGELHPDQARSILLDYLPEVRHREPFLHKVFEYLGF